MRKFYLLFVALLSATHIWAYNCKINEICYNLDWEAHTATVTYSGYPYNNDYTGHYGGGLKGAVINIPSTIEYNNVEYTVTSIGDDAFYDSGSNVLMASFTIPSTVTSIGSRAFWKCTNLTSFTIPSSVTTIGDHAFDWCSNLTTVIVEREIPLSITSETFSNRTNATLYVPYGSKAAYEAADYWKEFKEIVEMPAPSPIIEFADANVKALCVANWDTNSDGELSEAEAAAVKTLGDVFENKKNIISFNELIYFNGLTSINRYAFHNCTGLISITIPSNVTGIAYGAFDTCSSLISITIPSGVTSIGDFAFSDSGLTSVDIPNSVKTIGNAVFYGCTNLTSISLPDFITKISASSFWSCINLTSVTVPSNVTIIEKDAFYGCIKLPSVNIPSDVTTMGDRCFKSCRSLSVVTIPSNVSSIGSEAFADCGSLTEVTLENIIPVGISSSTFSNSANATLKVPAGSKSAYEAADYWKEFKEIVEIENGGSGGGEEENTDTDISSTSNVIYLNKVEARTNTQISLPIQMKNSAAIRGFQFDLYLPEGVTVVKNAKGKILASLNNGRLPEDDEHSLTLSEQTDGSIRFLCGSLYDETFTGNDGEIATLTVQIDENMADGDYPVILRNIKLTETDINNYYQTDYVKSTLTISSYMLGDINNDQQVDVSDYIGIANHILGNTPAGFNVKAADVNEDGNIDVSDYIGVANIILTGSVYGHSNARVFNFIKEEETQEVKPE